MVQRNADSSDSDDYEGDGLLSTSGSSSDSEEEEGAERLVLLSWTRLDLGEENEIAQAVETRARRRSSVEISDDQKTLLKKEMQSRASLAMSRASLQDAPAKIGMADLLRFTVLFLS